MADPKPPKHRVFNDDEGWLERLIQQEKKKPRPHSCGRCRTPYGTSALPCPNDPGV